MTAELAERRIEIGDFLTGDRVTNLPGLLAAMVSLASGGGVCMACRCRDCRRYVDPVLVDDVNGLTAMSESVDH